MKIQTPKALMLFLLATALCVVPELPAATRTKANNGDNLNLPSSWTNGIVPTGADMALFDSTLAGPLTVALGADLAWNQINFNNPGGDVTISAGSTLTLSNNNPITFGTGTADLTLNCDLNFAGAAFTTVRTPVGQTLTLGGALNGRDTTVTLGNSAGTIRLGGPNTVRIGSIVQITTANLKLGIGASSIGDPMASGPLGTNLFTWGASSVGTELFTYNGDQTLGNPVRVQSGPFNFNSSADLTFTGVVDLNNGNRTFHVANTGVLRFTGVFSNATGLIKTGSGALELGGTNMANWNNGLSIYGGVVRLLTNEWIPNGTGKGLLRMTNTAHVLDLNGFSDTINGLANNSFGNWAGTVDNTAPGTISVLTVGDDFTYTLVGNLQNTGLGAKLALVKIGTGGLILSNANTFSGGLTNHSASQVFLNTIGAAGTGPITLSHTNAELAYSGGGVLTWTNDILLAANTQPAISAADGSTLEVAGIVSGPGQLRRFSIFGQQGALAYSGDNTFTGGFWLTGGEVILRHPRALGRGLFSIGDPAFFSGGILGIVPDVDLSGGNAITNAVIVHRDFSINGSHPMEFAGPVVWSTNATPRSINVANPAGVVISGPMSGYGFNKTGVGLLTLNGVCSHNGPSTVSTGPLALGPGGAFTGATTILVGGSASFDVSAVVGFAVLPTQALRVENGSKVSGNVTINGSLTNNASFSSVTFSNNLTLAPGSTSVFTINRFNQTGTNLVCLGQLTFGGQLIVNNVSAALEVGDAFKLFSFTGNPGGFSGLTLPTLDPGLAWNTDNLAVDGTISVISAGPQPPQIANPQLAIPTSFIMTVTGGTANGQFRVLTHTNVDAPALHWEVLSTNTYDASGNLTVTNLVNPAESMRFFRTVEP